MAPRDSYIGMFNHLKELEGKSVLPGVSFEVSESQFQVSLTFCGTGCSSQLLLQHLLACQHAPYHGDNELKSL